MTLLVAAGFVKNLTSGLYCQVTFDPQLKEQTILPDSGNCVSLDDSMSTYARADVAFVSSSTGGSFQSFTHQLKKSFGPAEYMAPGAIPRFVDQSSGWYFMGGVSYEG